MLKDESRILKTYFLIKNKLEPISKNEQAIFEIGRWVFFIACSIILIGEAI